MTSLLSSKIVLIIILAVVIIAGVSWKTGLLSSVKPQPPKSQVLVQETPKLDGEFRLSPASQNVKVGDKVYLEISINSNNHPVAGVDIALKYDPTLLEPQISSSKVVQPSALFDSYPPQKMDKTKGEIIFSAIGKPRENKPINGFLGKAVFKALKSGNTKITINFTPGSTTDSNISDSDTTQDILGKVNSAEITISPN